MAFTLPDLIEFLRRKDACEDVLLWLRQQDSLASAWAELEDMDWFGWLTENAPGLETFWWDAWLSRQAIWDVYREPMREAAEAYRARCIVLNALLAEGTITRTEWETARAQAGQEHKQRTAAAEAARIWAIKETIPFIDVYVALERALR